MQSLPHRKHTTSPSVNVLKKNNYLFILRTVLLQTHKYKPWLYTEVDGTYNINGNAISRVQQVRCKSKSSVDTRVTQNILGRWAVSKDDIQILHQHCWLSRKIFIPRGNATCNCVHIIFMIWNYPLVWDAVAVRLCWALTIMLLLDLCSK